MPFARRHCGSNEQKAWPLLAKRQPLHDGVPPQVNRILRAAAPNFLAASLARLLKPGRRLALLRRQDNKCLSTAQWLAVVPIFCRA